MAPAVMWVPLFFPSLIRISDLVEDRMQLWISISDFVVIPIFDFVENTLAREKQYVPY